MNNYVLIKYRYTQSLCYAIFFLESYIFIKVLINIYNKKNNTKSVVIF